MKCGICQALIIDSFFIHTSVFVVITYKITGIFPEENLFSVCLNLISII
jgi:hypothetical protein